MSRKLLASILLVTPSMANFFRREQPAADAGPVISSEELRNRLLGSRAPSGSGAASAIKPPNLEALTPAQPPQNKPIEPAAVPAQKTELGVNPDRKESIDMSNAEPAGGSAAIAKMFGPARAFEERLAKLLAAFNQMNSLGEEATKTFEMASELAVRIGKFAQAYAPVKAFHGEVNTLAEEFDPLRSIQSQLTEMSRAFHDHLFYLAKVLEPASNIQVRLAQLAKAFEPAVELKRRFELIASEFEIPSSPAREAANGQSPNATARNSNGASPGLISNP